MDSTLRTCSDGKKVRIEKSFSLENNLYPFFVAFLIRKSVDKLQGFQLVAIRMKPSMRRRGRVLGWGAVFSILGFLHLQISPCFSS